VLASIIDNESEKKGGDPYKFSSGEEETKSQEKSKKRSINDVLQCGKSVAAKGRKNKKTSPKKKNKNSTARQYGRSSLLYYCSVTESSQDEDTGWKPSSDGKHSDPDREYPLSPSAAKQGGGRLKESSAESDKVDTITIAGTNSDSENTNPVSRVVPKKLKGKWGVSKICDVKLDKVADIMKENEGYLRDIFTGKIHCERHQQYKQSGKVRRNLNRKIHMGAITHDQEELIMELLLSFFCKNHHKYLDYVLKVMLPESMTKIHMDVFGTTHETSEEMLRDIPQEDFIQ